MGQRCLSTLYFSPRPSPLSCQVIKRGRNLILKIGDAEVEYDPRFRLYLQTKLSNPHYGPEVAAQTTLVNFCVTEKGLEDQLLALVRRRQQQRCCIGGEALLTVAYAALCKRGGAEQQL